MPNLWFEYAYMIPKINFFMRQESINVHFMSSFSLTHTHTHTNISNVVRTQVCAHKLLNVGIFVRTFFKWLELGKY